MPMMTMSLSGAKASMQPRARQVVRPSVSARSYGNQRWGPARRRRSSMQSCAPGRSPFEPFFDMQFSMSDPIFGMGLGMDCKPSSFKQRLNSRPMLLDVVETDDMFEIKADVPGVTKQNIKVDIDGDALTLSVLHPDAASATHTATDAPTATTVDTTTTATDATASKDSSSSSSDSDSASAASETTTGAAAASDKTKRTVHRRERGGDFAERTLRMPDSANLESVNAELVDGVLTVTVPKRDEAIPKRRQVPVA